MEKRYRNKIIIIIIIVWLRLWLGDGFALVCCALL